MSNLGPQRPDDDQVLLALLQRLDEPPCLPSHLLEGYVAGALSLRETEHVHAHLRQCVVCVGALARLQSMHADEPTPAPALVLAQGLIGRSTAFNRVQAQIGRLLLQSSMASIALPPLLIEGETGTGKSFLARLVHEAGPRRDGPFVHVNCGGIPESLLEAEMFGFERGAFSGLRHAKPGLLQTAHKGTIVLDEVEVLPPSLQAKLVKVLEEHTVRRIGSARSEAIDVWILTATSRDLKSAVRMHSFREDLYHRLAGITLSLPPLRERESDILMLAEHFLERACHEYDWPPKRLDAGAHSALLAYPWPGNVRELEHVIERAALFTEGEVITEEHLELPGAGESPASDIDDAERVVAAFRAAGGNLSRAAALLGIPRSTLHFRLTQLGLLPKKDEPGP